MLKIYFFMFLGKILCIDCIPSGSWYTWVLYLFEDHKEKRRNSRIYRVQKDVALHFNEGWQQTALSVFFWLQWALEYYFTFTDFFLLHPWTLFLLCVEMLTETVSLTRRFVPTALSATLWSRDHSTVFHLTCFRNASTLPAAGSGKVTAYCMDMHVSSPILTYLSKMLLNSRMNICYGPPKSASSIIHLSVPFRSGPLVAGHWGWRGWIVTKIEVFHGMCLEKEWWMDRQVGNVSHRGEYLTLCQDFPPSIFLPYVVVPWQLGETTCKLLFYPGYGFLLWVPILHSALPHAHPLVLCISSNPEGTFPTK